MYIIASMPPSYGQFNIIRRDNYPFNHYFTAYLEAIASLGLALSMDADRLVGYIEDALFLDERLPDIPEGGEAVSFRFTTKSEILEEYFKGSKLKNKLIITLIIRMTLRLSVRFGTSLARLTKLISEIDVNMNDTSSVPVKAPVPKRHLITMSENEDEPVVDKSVESVDKEPEPVKEPVPNTSNVLERLKDLTEKGDQLLQEKEEVPVVETNPFLSDFLG